ncbi:hypothetical protein Tco_1205160, partial [Tanacetum coccineum]
SSGSCVIGLLVVMVSLIEHIKCEHEAWKRIFKKRNKKKANSKQIQAWSGKGKVKSQAK